jgi:hypothetical protein
LGKANAKRRQFFFYCRTHQERLATVSHAEQNPHRSMLTNSEINSAVPKSAVSKPSNFYTTATTLIPSKVEFVDDGFDEVQSNSTLATNLRTDLSSMRLLVPLLSDYTEPGMPFECPYCRKLLQVNGQQGWK